MSILFKLIELICQQQAIIKLLAKWNVTCWLVIRPRGPITVSKILVSLHLPIERFSY